MKSVLHAAIPTEKFTCTEIQNKNIPSLSFCNSRMSKDKLSTLFLHVNVFNLPRTMLDFMFEIVKELYDHDRLN